MNQFFATGTLIGLLSFAPAAWAAERTVTLAVENMYCASCPYIVKKTMAAVPGVSKVDVSFKNKSAVVTYDDTQTTLDAVTKASADAGYPAKPVEQGR